MSKPVKKNAIDYFIEGARSGWTIGTTSMLPNVVMAFVIIRILNVTGIMDLLGEWAGGVMSLWGLPGQALAVLLAAFMSMGGGAGMAAAMAVDGVLTPVHVTILAPAIILMGALLQYMGRCLGTSGSNPKYWGWQIGIAIFNALIAMWILRFLLLFFGDSPAAA